MQDAAQRFESKKAERLVEAEKARREKPPNKRADPVN
jgi:hypothetical protein